LSHPRGARKTGTPAPAWPLGLVYCVKQNDDYSCRSTLPSVGQLGKLRPIANRPGALSFPNDGGCQPPRRMPSCPHDLDNRQYFGRTTLASVSVARVYPAARLRARPSSVVCVSAKRLSLPLTPHFFRNGPLRSTRHYPASSLLRASPPPSGPFAVIASRFPLARASQEGFPGSSRGSVLARRPRPPRRSGPVLARFFPAHGRLHPVRRTPPSRLSNEAESGSLALRLTSPPARGFNASGFPSRCSPASCCTSNYMLNSFRPPDLPDLSWRTECQRAALCAGRRLAALFVRGCPEYAGTEPRP
jgi:hypothetical protein